MNCHGNDHSHERTDEQGSGDARLGHSLMMALCCGLPLLLLALSPLLRGVGGGWFDTVARYSYLLCPIMMLPMMFMKRGGPQPAPKRRVGDYGRHEIEDRKSRNIAGRRH